MTFCFITQVLEGADLDFSRYGDTLFEVLFAGGRLAGGGNVVEEGKKLDTNVRLDSSDLLMLFWDILISPSHSFVCTL